MNAEMLMARPDMPQEPAPITVERVSRDNLSLRTLAILRMTVFRGWPYLYDGSLDQEAAYLAATLSNDAAVLIVARLGEIPIGMATASPMASQPDAVRTPFLAAGVDAGSLCYFGESVLLPQFHGLGIGHRFFDEREAAARQAGAMAAAFCAVQREEHHPRRPVTARDLTPFWRKRGYRPVPDFDIGMMWKEVGQSAESHHPMRFWLKQL